MVYKIYKNNNYIVVIDENDNYFEEHCATVLVTKNLTPDTTYTVTFFRPESTPQAFYNIPFANIRQQSGAPYASVAAWETWYTSNTGLCSNNVVLNSILATLQAQTDVEGVFVKDTGNSDKIVLQVKVWDQDSQTYIATYYYNPDGSLYTPVGPLEWVGTGGSVNATIINPLGDTTTCADSVAVTLCSGQATEFFDQGDTLDSILTQLQSTLDVSISAPKGVQADCADALSVALCQTQEDILTDINTAVQPINTITPNIESVIGTGSIAAAVYSITFFNSGPSTELISFDAGTTWVSIPAGVSITMDAGGINNKYPANIFHYDVIADGPIIITYNS